MTRQERRKRRRQRRRMQAALLASLLFALVLIVTLRIRETAPEPVAERTSELAAERQTLTYIAPARLEAAEETPEELTVEPELENRYAELHFSDEDVYILACLVYHEARGESFEGQVAVVEVVLNRMLSDYFPDTVEEVVFQKYGDVWQFSPAPYLYSAEPDKEQYLAVHTAIEEREHILSEDTVYFSTAPYNESVDMITRRRKRARPPLRVLYTYPGGRGGRKMNFPKLYECDPQKNTECNKRNCGNPCMHTTRKEFAREPSERMSIERAFEILDPTHRERYESLEPVNEACRMGRAALFLQMKESPYPDGDEGVLACPNCGSGEYLHNEDGNRNRFCGQCGKAIAWNEEADK